MPHARGLPREEPFASPQKPPRDSNHTPPQQRQRAQDPLTAVLGAALFGLSLGVAAQSTGGSTSSAGSPSGSTASPAKPAATQALDRADRRFVEKATTDGMAKLNGAQFDRAYMKHMVDEHQQDIREFEKASKSASDSDIKAFAARTLPTLQSHLELARTTNDALKEAR